MRKSTSYWEPMNEPSQYRWKAIADAVHPIDSASAEAARQHQMEEALRLNPACPSGYVVKNRLLTKKVDGFRYLQVTPRYNHVAI